MKNRLLIYGATGFTGGLIAREAKRLGLQPLLGGRNLRALDALSRALSLPWRAVGLDDDALLCEYLSDVKVLLNAAGPFAMTAEPLAKACIATGTHYLDIGGELDVMVNLAVLAHNEEKVLIMPAAAFSVMASEFLAFEFQRSTPSATCLRIALSTVPALSGGSARTAAASFRESVFVIRDRQKTWLSLGNLERAFTFEKGAEAETCAAVNLADTLAPYYSTKIPNVEAYVCVGMAGRALYEAGRWLATPLRFEPLKSIANAQAGFLARLWPAPADSSLTVVVEGEDVWRQPWRASVTVSDTYQFTAKAAAIAANVIMHGVANVGFQTPAQVLAGRQEMKNVFREGLAPVTGPWSTTSAAAPPWVG